MDENLLLSLIENNAKMEVVDLAAALNETEENVDKTIKDLEKNKTIYGYHTLINWDKTNHDVCTAVIQVNAKLKEIMDMIVLQKKSIIFQK